MKKIIWRAAAFALILTSCQEKEIVDGIKFGDDQLEFGIYQGKATKASELTNANLHTVGVNFPIHAYRGAQNKEKELYFNEILTFGNPITDKWNTSIPRFLSDTDPLQFYAYYAPGGTVSGTIPGATYTPPAGLAADVYPTLEYTIQSNTVDLVAATINDNLGTSVAIPFNHILSQINFGVKGYYGAQIKISNVVIKSVNNEGTFSFDPDSTVWGWTTQKGAEDYTYTCPNFKTPGGVLDVKWTDSNDESNNTYVLGDGGNWSVSKTSANVWYVTKDDTAIKSTEVTPGTTPKLANSLILMPQKLATGMTNAFVAFDYTIQDLEDNYVIGSENTPAKGQFDLNMDDPDATYGDEWKPNLRYLYVIDFTGYLNGQLLSFTVDVEEQPWVNYDGTTGSGIVLLSSLGEPIFTTSIKPLTNGGKYDIPAGNVFTNIAWNWAPYEMKTTFTTGQKFTVDFKNVRFNGNTITVTPPNGFNVSKEEGTSTAATPIVVTAPATVLTFTKQ